MIQVRTGVITDLPRALELIRELAEFENGLQHVTNSLSKMEEDGFGPTPVFGFFVAEENDFILGISLYYYRYSTWRGKRLYLEDIVVTARERGKGAGKALFERTMKFALETGCTGMKWQVLEWNEPAIKFYKKYKARLDKEWIDCSLEENDIKEFFR